MDAHMIYKILLAFLVGYLIGLATMYFIAEHYLQAECYARIYDRVIFNTTINFSEVGKMI